MTTKPPKTKPSCDLIHPVLSRFHNDDSYLTHNACEDIQKLFDTFYVAEIERLKKENNRLSLIVKQFKIWGSDECRKCQTNRVTLYASNIGMCYECNPKTRDEIEAAKGVK